MPATKIQSITVMGRRWFERNGGNTYHTVTILVNGEPVYTSDDMVYGYGDQYVQTAADWLEENGYIEREEHSNGNKAALWVHCRENDIQLHYSASDVSRKRDL